MRRRRHSVTFGDLLSVGQERRLPRSIVILRSAPMARLPRSAVRCGSRSFARPMPDSDQFWLTITFPGGEAFDIKLSRARLLQQLNIGDGES